MNQDISSVVKRFLFVGEFLDIRPYGAGHIHDTYVVCFRSPDRTISRYILQRLNTAVFEQPEQLMENIERVTAHLKAKIAASGGNPMRETLNLISTRAGRSFVRTGAGEYWRAFHFIERSQTYDTAVNWEHVAEVAKAYGLFLKRLSDFPLQQLHETIPDFHNITRRYEGLMLAVERDVKNRASRVKPEITFVEDRLDDVSLFARLLEQGELPGCVKFCV